MLDPIVTQAVLTVEYPLLQDRARRAGWEVTFNHESLILEVRLTHEKAGQLYILRGYLDGYKAIPPAWEFVDPDTGDEGTAAAYPEPPNPTPGGGASVFLKTYPPRQRVICLPCNRLAYGEHQGPHREWTLANWMQVSFNYQTLCEMVNRINVDLQASPGPQGPRKGKAA